MEIAMKTVQLFEVLRLTQDTENGAKIADSLIQDQVVQGLETLERSLLDDFARSKGFFSAEERSNWRNSPSAEVIRERIQHYLRQMIRRF